MGNRNNGYRFGNEDAEFVIIRDYPTRQECANGDGNTRQNIWLASELSKIGFNSSMYHIVNLINCFPNRPVYPDEVKLCSANLNNIIKTKPKIVMTLGLESYNYMTGYGVRSIKQAISHCTDNGKLIICPNLTVGQAMHRKESSLLFTKQLVKVKQFYRMKIDIDI
jgi:uracil-DNA glycosylase family 4